MLSSRENKIMGALYGFAIGDSMGATMEFRDKIADESKKIKDLIGGGWLNLTPGETTDDTQMTVCVLKALIENVGNPCKSFDSLCAKNFIDWFNSNPKDIGNTCSRVLEEAKIMLDEGKAIHVIANEMKLIAYNSFALGNGALMRALPCVLFKNLYNNLSQAFMTHNNETQLNHIIAYDSVVSSLIESNTVGINTNGFDAVSESLREGMMAPTGCVDNTMNNAYYHVFSSFSFEESIIKAVNNGGDADTIAAITGSIAGARFGYDMIPKRWIKVFRGNSLNYETLELFEKVPEVLDKLKIY